MRRVLSILLALALGLPLVASVFQLAAPSQVPLCCRKGGMHHCMETTLSYGATPHLRGICPSFPRAAGAIQTATFIITRQPSSASASPTHTFLIGQVEAGYRIALGRSGWKRGPPQLTI